MNELTLTYSHGFHLNDNRLVSDLVVQSCSTHYSYFCFSDVFKHKRIHSLFTECVSVYVYVRACAHGCVRACVSTCVGVCVGVGV